MFTRPGNWPPGGSTLNCSGDVAPPLGTRGLAALWFITHDGSIVLLYIVTWIPSIYPSHVSTYTSTMDPMGYKRVINHQLCIPGQYLYIYNCIPMLLFLSPTCGFRQVFQGFYPATTYSGWWFQPTPLKNMSSSVGSWDDDIPIYEMESHKIQRSKPPTCQSWVAYGIVLTTWVNPKKKKTAPQRLCLGFPDHLCAVRQHPHDLCFLLRWWIFTTVFCVTQHLSDLVSTLSIHNHSHISYIIYIYYNIINYYI